MRDETRVNKETKMESHPGLGVMIQAFSGGGRGGEHVENCKGRTIAEINVTDDCCTITFSDRSKLKLQDAGQSCCESRYMRTDDKPEEFVGATLANVEIGDAPEIEAGGECHEVQFLRILTSNGTFVCSAHNEHNGYYGGFWIVASEEGAS